MNETHIDHLLDKLPEARGAAFDSRELKSITTCLPGTRVSVLGEISDWYRSSSPGPSIYWLKGMAGTGKSTIARTVAKTCDAEDRLGASFFFSKGNENLSNARLFFTTIAFQLANTVPDLKPPMCNAITRTPRIHDKNLEVQWERLILRPLAHIKGVARNAFVVVIDALDECADEADVQEILRLLSQANDLPTARLKVFVTSRPELTIREGFRDMPEIHYKHLVLQDVPQESIENDLSVFFRKELKGVVEDSQTLSRLIEKAGGLFIWAATACRYLTEARQVMDKTRRLSILLGDGTTRTNPEKELDKLYESIVLGSIKGTYDDDEYKAVSQCFRSIVGSIVLVFIPFSGDALSRLLAVERETVEMILENLHSVLDIPDGSSRPLRVLHLSFRDFLLDPTRCTDQDFRVRDRDTHRELFVCCLRIMEQQLKRDICNLGDPGSQVGSINQATIRKCISHELRYSCQYWIQHLHASGIAVSDNGKTHEFQKQHTLHWLEALSLLGKLSEGIRAVEVLDSIVTVSSTCAQSQNTDASYIF